MRLQSNRHVVFLEGACVGVFLAILAIVLGLQFQRYHSLEDMINAIRGTLPRQEQQDPKPVSFYPEPVKTAKIFFNFPLDKV